MEDSIDRIIPVDIEDEMKTSYIDYSMSVIVSRALPDVRDGLKPVHRRVLYSMNESGNTYNNPTRKCARAVGDIMGKSGALTYCINSSTVISPRASM